MFPKINPTSTEAWQALQQHFSIMKDVQIKNLFANDSNRFNQFSIQLNEILFDYSKNNITENTIELLLQLANECKLKEPLKHNLLVKK